MDHPGCILIKPYKCWLSKMLCWTTVMGLRIYQLVQMIQFTINSTLLYFGVHLVALEVFPQDGMPAYKTWSYVHCVRIGEGLVKWGNDTHAHEISIATHNPSKHTKTNKTNKSMLITPVFPQL